MTLTFAKRSRRIRLICRALALEISTIIKISHGGTAYWFNLKQRERSNILGDITDLIHYKIYNDQFIYICFKACLSPTGHPSVNGRELAKWIQFNLFNNSYMKMHLKWIELARQHPEDWVLPPPV